MILGVLKVVWKSWWRGVIACVCVGGVGTLRKGIVMAYYKGHKELCRIFTYAVGKKGVHNLLNLRFDGDWGGAGCVDVVARMLAHGAELIGEMRYGDSYRLAYIRGPEGIIAGLAEEIRKAPKRTEPRAARSKPFSRSKAGGRNNTSRKSGGARKKRDRQQKHRERLTHSRSSRP